MFSNSHIVYKTKRWKLFHKKTKRKQRSQFGSNLFQGIWRENKQSYIHFLSPKLIHSLHLPIIFLHLFIHGSFSHPKLPLLLYFIAAKEYHRWCFHHPSYNDGIFEIYDSFSQWDWKKEYKVVLSWLLSRLCRWWKYMLWFHSHGGYSSWSCQM
jgi:hypothetical protein